MTDTPGAADINGGREKPGPKELVPYSQVLFEQFIPLLPRYAMGLDILAADVQFSHLHQQTGQLVQGYALIVTVRGALIGYQYNLTNQSFITGHVPPTEQETISIITATCTALREAKAQQGGVNGQPNMGQMPPGLPKDFS